MAEITDQDKLEWWLAGKPADVSVAIAARAALRTLPALALVEIDREFAADVVLPVFRAAAVAWTASAFTTDAPRIYALAAEAAFFIADDIASAAEAAAAADAAAAAADAAGADRADVAAIAVAAAGYAAKLGESHWRALSADTTWLERGLSGWDLAHLPLYVEPPRKGRLLWALPRTEVTPRGTSDLWSELKRGLPALSDDWHVWTTWYEDRLYGRQPLETLEVRRVLVPYEEGLWEKGPAVVNARIRELIEEYTPKGSPDALESLEQGPAAFRFRLNNGQVDVARIAYDARDTSGAKTHFAEARRKADDLLERLERSQADRRVADTIRDLIETLGTDVAEINPHLVRSHWRNAEADAEAFASAGAEAELFPDAIAQLRSLSGTLEDLLACYKETRDLERELAAIQIAGKVDAVLERMDAITAQVKELLEWQDPIITHATVDALTAQDGEISRARNETAREDLVTSKFLVHRNFGSYVLRNALLASREVAEYGKRLWRGAKGDAEVLGKKSPTALLAYLLGYDYIALGILIGGTALEKVKKAAEQLKNQAEDDKDDASESDASDKDKP